MYKCSSNSVYICMCRYKYIHTISVLQLVNIQQAVRKSQTSNGLHSLEFLEMK